MSQKERVIYLMTLFWQTDNETLQDKIIRSIFENLKEGDSQ